MTDLYKEYRELEDVLRECTEHDDCEASCRFAKHDEIDGATESGYYCKFGCVANIMLKAADAINDLREYAYESR